MHAQTPTMSSFDRLAEASGLRLLAGLLRQSLKPERLGVAFLGIVATLVLTSVLDTVWVWAGEGVEADALELSLVHAAPPPASNPPPATGPWEVFWATERGAIVGVLATAVPGLSSWKSGSGGAFVQACISNRSLLDHLSRGCGAVCWLLAHHTFYFVLLMAGLIAIWSAVGGVISRMAALEMTRGEASPLPPAVRFTRRHFASLFFAPLFPILLSALGVVFLLAFGLLLRLPFFGDIVGGVLFCLALLVGFGVTVLMIGAVAGGPLMTPAVAVDGEDAFNAFSRAVNYTFRKPWKTAWYAAVVLVYAGLCWLAAALVAWAGVGLTRGLISWMGATPLGVGARGSGEKITTAWPIHGPMELFTWPTSEHLTGSDHIAAFFIGLCALTVTGLLWALLASLYVHATTAVYLLLRRDADGTDIEEVILEEA